MLPHPEDQTALSEEIARLKVEIERLESLDEAAHAERLDGLRGRLRQLEQQLKLTDEIELDQNLKRKLGECEP